MHVIREKKSSIKELIYKSIVYVSKESCFFLVINVSDIVWSMFSIVSVSSSPMSELFSSNRVQNTSEMTKMNESILNHLFLPCHLPNSADGDFLINDEHQNEYKLLTSMKQFLESLNDKLRLPIFPILINCISRWRDLQDPNKVSAVNLQKTIDQLEAGDFLPLYFHTHNAAILTEIDTNGVNRPLVSAWQVQLSTKNITSSLLPHFSCFPVPIVELQDRSELRSTAHCELLIDFMKNSLEYSQSYRRSRSHDETREITMSHYVTEWWISHFQGINNNNRDHPSISFRKKHRDQIRWKDASVPFRRSGLWMAMKTVVQTILVKKLGTFGRIVYKLLITLFLTQIVYTRQQSLDSRISNVDLLMHCLKKVVRRLNKINFSWYTIEHDDVYSWAQNVIDEVKMKLDEIIPNSTWQIPIERDKKKRQKSLTIPSKFNKTEYCSHSCQKLKAYLDEQSSCPSHQQIVSQYQQYDSIKTSTQFENELPSATTLTNPNTDTVGIALTIVETWFETNLDRWMHRLSLSDDAARRFKELLDLFEVYQKKALEHYYSENQSSDSLGYSRFILTSLTILRSMHRKLCTDQRFERLSLHSIEIPHLLELFEFLSLTNRDEMSRARELYDYFQGFSQKRYPDLLGSIEANNAFGIHFASQSMEMKETLQKIRAEAERDKEEKIEEVRRAKERYDEMMRKANQLQCECTYVHSFFRGRHREHWQKCERCKMMASARNIRVDIYECPIPSNEQSALAVVFELQMPTEFRCYREILWQIVNRPNPNPTICRYEWLAVSPYQYKLGKFFTGPGNCKVKLVSHRGSLTQSHYSRSLPVGSTSLERYLHENNLDVAISPTKPTELSNECRTLTPQLDHANYKQLQFTMNSTQFEQNRAIAQSIQCPLGLKTTEFVEFGSFRSGHRLQWWNLLSALELDSLSFDNESVVLLIIHSLIQNGPTTNEVDKLISSWCSESHQPLLDDNFVDELIFRLDRRLDDCRSNWQNEMLFILIAIVTMRILTICNSTKTERLIALALKCRIISEESIEKMSQIFKKTNSININETAKLRDKVVIIGTACLFTFSMHPDLQSWSNASIVSLLKAATSIHDNIILNKKPASMSVFMRNLIRWRERILVKIRPAIAQFLHETSYQSFHQFTESHWGVIRTNKLTTGQWKKQTTSHYESCYETQYGSVKVSIDCLHGRFLVDGMSIDYLPNDNHLACFIPKNIRSAYI